MKSLLEKVELLAADPRIGFDLVRGVLGLGLFVQGCSFIAHPSGVLALFGGWGTSMLLGHYVAMALLGGGPLLAMGLATRVAAFLQAPVLFGAILLGRDHARFLGSVPSRELALLALVLLLAYAVFGSGPLSVDQRLLRHGLAPDAWRRQRIRHAHRHAV